jgi:hypothetical protein
MSQNRTESRNGEVRVTLQTFAPLPPLSRPQRKRLLQERFQDLAEEFRTTGLTVDLDAVSVSGQTAEAVIPADRFEELVRNLGKKEVRVDRLREVQVAPPF